jgi:hypothetical protein
MMVFTTHYHHCYCGGGSWSHYQLWLHCHHHGGEPLPLLSHCGIEPLHCGVEPSHCGVESLSSCSVIIELPPCCHCAFHHQIIIMVLILLSHHHCVAVKCYVNSLRRQIHQPHASLFSKCTPLVLHTKMAKK